VAKVLLKTSANARRSDAACPILIAARAVAENKNRIDAVESSSLKSFVRRYFLGLGLWIRIRWEAHLPAGRGRWEAKSQHAPANSQQGGYWEFAVQMTLNRRLGRDPGQAEIPVGR
jgi:hypothetical protein